MFIESTFSSVVFQVKRLQPETSPHPPVVPQPEVYHCQHQNQLPPQLQLRPQPTELVSPLHHPKPPNAVSCSRAGDPHRGSPLHLSADSACSTSSMPGTDPASWLLPVPQLGRPHLQQFSAEVDVLEGRVGWKVGQDSKTEKTSNKNMFSQLIIFRYSNINVPSDKYLICKHKVWYLINM